MNSLCDCEKCKKRYMKQKLKGLGFEFNEEYDGLYASNKVDWKFFPLKMIVILSMCEKTITAKFWVDWRQMTDEASKKTEEIKSWPVEEFEDFLNYCKEYLEDY